MSERDARRGGVGAPFYAPPRRKTSAEIISEARAAIYGELSGMSSSNVGSGAGGALRSLRTRRPYTPRDPQRTLYMERTRKKDVRPPSGLDVKYLSLSESGEESLITMETRLAELDEDALDEMLADTRNGKKKPQMRPSQRTSQMQSMERSGDGWSGFTKLPHLSGRSKPLHRRNTTGQTHLEDTKPEADLTHAISLVRPLGDSEVKSHTSNSKSSTEFNVKRSQFSQNKTVPYNAGSGDVSTIEVKHLAVQLPHTSIDSSHSNLTILDLSDALTQRNREAQKTIQLLKGVIAAVEETQPAGNLREMLIRALYTHFDHQNDEVLVNVARALLTMRVTGSHLTSACKLVFKIAKNDNNDNFFRDTNLLELVVEGCGRADPVSESATCVFGCAALRVVALEPRLAARAVRAGAVHLAALHLKILNNYKSENPRLVDEQCTHALFQVTGALRSLATVVDTHAQEFVVSGALPELVAALTLHTDRDVLTNVARCLSVVSGSPRCCAALRACGAAVRALLRALAACGARAPLAVRLAYTLGNMAADDEDARDDIYNEDGGIDVLLTILESYVVRSSTVCRDTDIDPDVHLIGTDLGGSDGSDEDVLIKTVRVLANLCLSEPAGQGLATTHAERTVKALKSCLLVAEKHIASEALLEEDYMNVMERREELATAAFATLNNLTFYREPPGPPDPVHVHFDEICKVTCRWVSLGAQSGAACEAVRALGNMSRAPRTAQLLTLEGALDSLEPFLHHDLVAVRCAAAGVLVNVCGAGASSSEAAALAARALCACAERGDAGPAPLLARALWNAHAHAPHQLDPARAQEVTAALAAFIDDESVFAACEGSPNDVEDQHTDNTIAKHHVTFEAENNKIREEYEARYSVKGGESEADSAGSDLGFEEGDADECTCAACRRLAHWDQLVAVALPLLERLRPARLDAAVGTD